MADPIEDDLLATIAGSALLQAMGCPRRIASAGGIDESNGRRWARGEKANPLYRTRQLVERAADPWAICAYIVAVTIRAELARSPMPEWRWRAMYQQALEAEQACDGTEDGTTQRMLLGKASLADQVAADGQVASATLRRLALGIIGMHHGWSVQGPRAH